MTGTDLRVNKPHCAALCDLERVEPQPQSRSYLNQLVFYERHKHKFSNSKFRQVAVGAKKGAFCYFYICISEDTLLPVENTLSLSKRSMVWSLLSFELFEHRIFILNYWHYLWFSICCLHFSADKYVAAWVAWFDLCYTTNVHMSFFGHNVARHCSSESSPLSTVIIFCCSAVQNGYVFRFKKVKNSTWMHRNYTNFFVRFVRSGKSPAKKFPAAGIALDTHCWHCATENWEADVIKTSSHLSLTWTRQENIADVSRFFTSL
jgi:hypothetical protein